MLCLVLLAWVSALSSAQPSPNPGASSTAYVGGYWMEGDRFVKRDTTWAKQGVFVAERPARVERIVHLGERFVVPPFGDAHLHALDDPGSLASQDSLLVSRGVFYVLNPSVPATERASVLGWATQVEVSYAVSPITAPGAHPATAYEARALGLQAWDVWGPRGDEIRASRLRAGDAYHHAMTVGDLDAVWPAIQASGTEWVKVMLDHSDEWADRIPAQPRGLSPEVVHEIVQRAHAGGLRVVAHVVTAADATVALTAGADLLAHAPGAMINDADPVVAEGGAYVSSDALLRRMAGTPVTPTMARGPAMVRYIPENARPDSSTLARIGAFHADLLRRMAAAGVPIAIGADSGGLWAWDEVAYAIEIGGLTPMQALHAWTVTTPQAIFSSRQLGHLAAGFEASFLALACDPLMDWSCTAQISHREKQGLDLDMAETAERWRQLDVPMFTAPLGDTDGPLLRGLKALVDADFAVAHVELATALASAPDSLRPFVRARLAEVAEEQFRWADALAFARVDDPSADGSIVAGFSRFPEARLRLDVPETSVPFDGLRIPVSVNGVALPAIVDTGGGGTSIPRQLAERLGLRTDTTARGVSVIPSLNLVSEKYAVLVDSLRVGDALFTNVPATVSLREDDGTEASEMFLGASLLRHLTRAIEYNYVDSTFTIVRDVAETDEPPMFMVEPGTGAPALRVEVDGQPANALVDTGNAAPVYLASGAFDVADRPIVRTATGTLSNGFEWSQSYFTVPFRIPGHPDAEHEAFEAGYIFQKDSPATVILGEPVWSSGTLTLDFVNRRVRFEPGE